jgi:glucose-1-phosphate thymidylyltransferase
VKGVILAGGSGTRLDPLTRARNKHLLDIAGRPMVTYAVEALQGAGVSELLLVTGEEHADAFRTVLGDGIACAYQEGAGGIAEALGLAEEHVGRAPCVVLLADNVLERSIRPFVERFERRPRGARIVLAREPEVEHLRHLGVAELDGGGRIVSIVEKPERPPSDLAVTGLYFYDDAVWEVLPTLEPSGRGELEITDVNNWYVGRRAMEYDVLDGFWGDAGESIEAYRAVDAFVRANGANRT